MMGLHWFTSTWWKYILEKPVGTYARDVTWPTRIICRVRGHPKGPIWYNPNGLEPDGRCRECGDWIA